MSKQAQRGSPRAKQPALKLTVSKIKTKPDINGHASSARPLCAARFPEYASVRVLPPKSVAAPRTQSTHKLPTTKLVDGEVVFRPSGFCPGSLPVALGKPMSQHARR
eukprot:TRINITY_DN13669_c0_g1_i2.p1 TRINITY_DN13669_c0_g1~~TRINITY_DN13669_c0_g1_i2.p1  ORF type:complete len:107 (-),score=14.95 TRINITY_DN13669_c0_g1_i2:543-863(-)